MKSTPASDGVWRRLVARPLWERKAAGSNPATPTDDQHPDRLRAADPRLHSAGPGSGGPKCGGRATSGHRAACPVRRCEVGWPEVQDVAGSDEVGAELGDAPTGGQALGLEPVP